MTIFTVTVVTITIAVIMNCLNPGAYTCDNIIFFMQWTDHAGYLTEITNIILYIMVLPLSDLVQTLPEKVCQLQPFK